VYVSPGNGGHVELDCRPIGSCYVELEGYRLTADPRASVSAPAVQHLPLGTEIRLSAVPAFGYRFDGWSGDIVSSDPQVAATLGLTTRLTANFSLVMPLWVIPIAAAAIAIPLVLLWWHRRVRQDAAVVNEPPGI
jgi:hypothetical protein